MTLRDKIVEESLTWVNTPFRDEQGVKGAGVDCAYLPLRVCQAVGLISPDYKPAHYSPQVMLNSPLQTNKWALRHETTTEYLETIHKFCVEISESEVQPGDFVLFKVGTSWAHGGIVIRYPDFILHPIRGRGVIGSTLGEGFLKRRQRRFFSIVRKVEQQTDAA